VSEATAPETFAVAGFKIAATAAGIKKSGLDLGLLYSDRPATTAAVFTRNAFAAAPILVTREHLKQSGNMTRAILVNAGNANAVTGEAGMNAARQCAAELARHAGCKPSEIFLSSTGVIGRPLPLDKICGGIPRLLYTMDPHGADVFSRAIMTTDTVPKLAASEAGGVRMLGFAKGSGMIHPNMATMLSYVVTDAKMDFAALDKALRYAVDRSFHSITVDGDTSTNDTVAILANGASGVSPSLNTFTAQLTEVCQTLAKAVARDGEGATKFVELTIEGAPSDEAARDIGRTIARSPLVKTAIYGCDPNWGRLICAVGNSGIPLSGESVELFIDDVPLVNGDLKLASEKLNSKEVRIRVSLHSGLGQATVWTCDLTEDYIKINADYTT
jgi:glutamate N-acetyltransferase / amino-acid N-acetyltransferase